MQTVITADGPLRDQLREAKGPVEFREPSGKLLGIYTPALSPQAAELHTQAAQLFDFKEAERILATERDRGSSLEEVKRRLTSANKG
jgi:hypothetical protein